MTKVILFDDHIPTFLYKLLQDLNLSTNKDEIRFNTDLIAEIEKISVKVDRMNDIGLSLIALSNDVFAVRENESVVRYYSSYIKNIEHDTAERNACSLTIEEYDEMIPHILKDESIIKLCTLDETHNIWTLAGYKSEEII